MSSPNLPKPFWERADEELIKWEVWWKIFEAYLHLKENFYKQSLRLKACHGEAADPAADAANLADLYPDNVKNDELWTALGEEGQRHFDTTEDAANYVTWPFDQMKKACTDLFRKPKNAIVGFIDLIRRMKRPDELVNSYLTELCAIVHDCQFPQDAEALLLRNVLVSNCGTQSFRKRFVRQKTVT
ncbi:MAG: hypothetical protein GY799_01065, partial [Desulfobulbaceae bacterium]|nr:hypothetical protein [Desulfobulbaceae bacterium]